MKKNVILLVITIITISLIGLIGIQLYWIRNAIAVKEAHFENGVSEAITNATYKFNKIILAQKLLFEEKQSQQLNSFFNSLDSINYSYLNKIRDDEPGHIREDEDDNPDIFYFGGEFYMHFRNSNDIDKITPFDTTFATQHKPRELPEQTGYRETPAVTNFRNTENLIEKSKLINDILTDLFSSDKHLTFDSALNKSVLDSLIKTELNNSGIFADYEFGIYNPKNNSLDFEKTGKHSDKLLNKGYAYSLYPSTVFRNPEYLLIYFPGQKRYILAEMNIMMLVSTILIIIIITSFAYTMFTVIKQKKLSIMKNDFINNMTHELKTPISTISLACQALSDRDVQKSEKLYQNYINIINEENQRLESMTEKVLQTALIDKGKLKLNKTYVDVHKLLSDAINKISLQVERTDGTISTNFLAKQPVIKADKIHLTNCFLNLLDNANKYTESSPFITVSTQNNDKGVFISIKDNGIGISKASQQKIFDTLYRISTGNIHNVKGFGLGLPYVKSIIELHDGEVFLESEIKKGSTFTIFVPFDNNS